MAQSVIDAALAKIDGQIADLQRSKQIIIDAAEAGTSDAAPKQRKPRKPRSKPGLPSEGL